MEEDSISHSSDDEQDLIDVVMTGGPPWGFNISGGSEFGRRLIVGNVMKEGIACKVGGLRENDTLVYINDVKYTSRARAIEAVRFSKAKALKLKFRRNTSEDSRSNSANNHNAMTNDFVVSPNRPKRSRSYYDSMVVENMLENMSSDIASTHYSNRKNFIRGGSLKKIDATAAKMETGSPNSDKEEQIEGSISSDSECNDGLKRRSPGNVQRVTIKSVNVTAMVPKAKDVVAEQVKMKLDITNGAGKDALLAHKKTDAVSSDRSQIEHQTIKANNECIEQTRSIDESDPTFRHFGANPSGLRKTEYGNRYLRSATTAATTEQQQTADSGIETAVLSVSRARAMFEGISKSQENLASSPPKSQSTGCLSKSTADHSITTTSRHEIPVSRPASSIPSGNASFEPKHSHARSLPIESEEAGAGRAIRRPGSAPNRRSDRKIKAKSAHFPSDKEIFQSQNLPLGYADVSTSSGSIQHGRKSIATCAPSVTGYSYKKESSFRHSSEDLRPLPLPANRMREAAKKFHQDLMRKDPKFRYSLTSGEGGTRPSPLGSFAGGSSGSSIGSSQDTLNAIDLSRRASGPTFFTKASSTSNLLDSPTSHSDAVYSPVEDEDNSILSRLMREQRLNSGGNLVRIDEEARSPRLKDSNNHRVDAIANTSGGNGVLVSDIEESKPVSLTKRSMSIQTDFVVEAASNSDNSPQQITSTEDLKPSSSHNPSTEDTKPSSRDSPSTEDATHSSRHSPSNPVINALKNSPATRLPAPVSPIETDLDKVVKSRETVCKSNEDIVPPTQVDAEVPPIDNVRIQENHPTQEDSLIQEIPLKIKHEKEASSDSIQELETINDSSNSRELDDKELVDFPVPDIDALPPPPDDLLIGSSPPEKEKPQRVINRKKRDQHSNIISSRNSSCVSTDSTISNSTSDSGIGVRAFSTSESPRTSPTRDTPGFDDYDKDQNPDEGFKSSREALNDDGYGPGDQATSDYQPEDAARCETPGSSRSSSRPDSMIFASPKIEELDQEKATLADSMRRKIEELKSQEREIADEIKLNEDLGKKVRHMVETKAMQSEFAKYELFIGELNKIVALLLSLTQRLHRYEQMLQDLDMSEEEDKEKRDTLVSKIEKLKSQHEEACYLREVNDKRGENVANFLDKYFNEEEFQDFLYYVDMKSQLALMQSEIKEKVKLGEERYKALASTGIWTNSPEK